MATEVERVKMVYTDAKGNSNKVWSGVLYDDGTVTTEWGRIGATNMQSKDFPGAGKTFLDKKAKEKEKKGYRQVKTIDGNVGGTPSGSRDSGTKIANVQLKDIAKRELGNGNKEIEKLVERLAEVNRHQIAAASGGKITVSTSGLVTTELGDVVDLDTITEARDYLTEMADALNKPKTNFDANYWLDPFNEYLKRIPKNIGHTQTRDWHKTTFTSLSDIQQQNSFLDQLEATIKNTMTATQSTQAAASSNQPRVFDTEIDLLTDQKEWDRIDKFYTSKAKSMHACYGYKLHKVYTVKIPKMEQAYQSHGAKMSNIWELWHGSSASNILSILKTGYVVPPASAGHVTGRMFGDLGLYFSDISTKSLNYSYGYWSGSRSNDSCFMFLNDVAMGNYYIPKRSTSASPPSCYDSYYAKEYDSPIQNNDLKIHITHLVNIKYLVEFSR